MPFSDANKRSCKWTFAYRCNDVPLNFLRIMLSLFPSEGDQIYHFIQRHTFLEMLSVDDCSDVTSFPALSSLRSLTIRDCPNFTFSGHPSVLFPRLVQLRLGGFSSQQLTHLIMRATGSPLERLLIEGCDDLLRFDGDLELHLCFFPSLRELEISRCINLQRLALGRRGFKALRKLSINGCSQLSSLPEKGLPIFLESLRIIGCPALEAWFGRQDGNRHRKWISHMPYMEIEREPILLSLLWEN